MERQLQVTEKARGIFPMFPCGCAMYNDNDNAHSEAQAASCKCLIEIPILAANMNPRGTECGYCHCTLHSHEPCAYGRGLWIVDVAAVMYNLYNITKTAAPTCTAESRWIWGIGIEIRTDHANQDQHTNLRRPVTYNGIWDGQPWRLVTDG